MATTMKKNQKFLDEQGWDLEKLKQLGHIDTFLTRAKWDLTDLRNLLKVDIAMKDHDVNPDDLPDIFVTHKMLVKNMFHNKKIILKQNNDYDEDDLIGDSNDNNNNDNSNNIDYDTLINKVDEISRALINPKNKGNIGEKLVMRQLQQYYPNIKNVSNNAKDTDLHITLGGYLYLIECKFYSKTVPTTQVEKFKRDVTNKSNCKIGFMVSPTSNIAHINSDIHFIYNDNKQLEVYISNIDVDVMARIIQAIIENYVLDEKSKFAHETDQQKVMSMFETFISSVKSQTDYIKTISYTISDIKRSLNKLQYQITDASDKILNICSNYNKDIDEYRKIKKYKQFDELSDSEKVTYYFDDFFRNHIPLKSAENIRQLKYILHDQDITWVVVKEEEEDTNMLLAELYYDRFLVATIVPKFTNKATDIFYFNIKYSSKNKKNMRITSSVEKIKENILEIIEILPKN